MIQSEGMIHSIIGLVGHVSNGKSTLVKALTGSDTRRRQSEKESGRTVDLGYASLYLWRCKNNHNSSSGIEVKEMKCDCGEDMVISRKISLTDCPGHHSYVATMARGGAVMDGAIFVTDVRSETLQPQTVEHLMIMEMFGVKNVLVIQNKVDLASKEICKSNYEMLRKELKNTIAENSPVIPMIAQRSVNLRRVVDYMYEMTCPSRINLRNNGALTIIRSFDINKPGADESELKGGVLGIVSLGNSTCKIGDVVELRPKPKGSDIPLLTTIKSIKVEKTSVDSIERGCLHGIETTIDPSLTKADGLVGCLIGNSKDLPECINTIKCKVHKLKGCNSVKKDDFVILIVGTKTVKAKCTSSEKTHTFILESEICTLENRCLIYDQRMNLLGIGIFVNSENLEKEIKPLDFSYEKELGIFPSDIEVYEREKCPLIKVVSNNRDTIWTNAVEFCTFTKRDINLIRTYLAEETCKDVSICKDGIRFSKLKIGERQLMNLVARFIKDTSCKECKSMFVSNKKCERCGAQ